MIGVQAPLYTKYFNWRNGSGGLHQVWYDDADTLAPKYALAKKSKLKAIGMWTSDANMFNAVAASVSALPLRSPVSWRTS